MAFANYKSVTMRRNYPILLRIMSLLLGILPLSGAAGQLILQDDFERYSMTQQLCEQSDLWRTWSGESTHMQDTYLTFAYPDTNTTLKIQGSRAHLGGGPTDVVLRLGDLREGIYNVSFDI